MTKSPGLTDEVFQVSSRISLNIICIGHQSSVLSAMRSCAQWCWSFRYGAISKQEGRLNQMSINQDFTLYLNVPLQTNVPSYFWMKKMGWQIHSQVSCSNCCICFDSSDVTDLPALQEAEAGANGC